MDKAPVLSSAGPFIGNVQHLPCPAKLIYSLDIKSANISAIFGSNCVPAFSLII